MQTETSIPNISEIVTPKTEQSDKRMEKVELVETPKKEGRNLPKRAFEPVLAEDGPVSFLRL